MSPESRCLKGWMEPRLPHEPGQPFPTRQRAVKYGPYCLFSQTQSYRARGPRFCRLHRVLLTSQSCECSEVYLRDGTGDSCRQGCTTVSGAPAKKFSSDCQCKTTSSRKCAAGCVDPAGKRAAKYSEHCKCVDPRRSPGYCSIACNCQSPSCSHSSRLPTLDKRDKNAQAKRIARDLDRGPLPPPLPPVGSLPWAEYGKIPFEMRQSREKAEKRARESSWNVRSQMARANLLNYVEPKYRSDSTLVHQPIYGLDGPTRVSFDLWCCPIHTTESSPFRPPALCGHLINLRTMSNGITVRDSVALMETEFRKVFNEAICLHIREHMNRLGLDFDSNGIGIIRNDCRSIVPYIPPIFT
ncbi:hypothetical protein B0H13DRAFT_2131741 [Mycena leptocephala]|nr:hypothetical protein B0H13DRAFT_2131741 [Mycena leptocephala]